MNAQVLNQLNTSASTSIPELRTTVTPPVTSTVEEIIHQQLRLMARQLEFLRGSRAGSDSPIYITPSSTGTGASLRLIEAEATNGEFAVSVPASTALTGADSNGAGVESNRSTIGHAPHAQASGSMAQESVNVPPLSAVDLAQIEAVLNKHPAIMFSRVLVRESEPGKRLLAAYVVERKGGDADGKDEIGYWRGVWEEMHHSSIVEAGTGGDPTHAFLRSIKIENPEDQERQFTFQTADRVRALGATSVYEIGCGTGGLVRALHPHCQTFWASDFSDSAVSFLRGQLSGADGKLPCGVELFQRAADDFTGIVPESFDLVLIHSVVQYFPDVAYLLRVIDGAIHSTRSGGCVYLGAIQNLASYEAYHTNLQAQRAPADLPVGELKKRVRKRLDSGEEFTIDPGFFRVLSRQNSRIAAVDIRLRRGDYHNKSTKFLYDAILHVEETPVHIRVNNWLTLGDAGLPEIRRLLEAQKPETIGFRSLLNSRLQGEIDRFRSIVAAGPATPLRQVLLSANPKLNAVDPEHLWKLGESLGYQVHVNWAADGNPSGMDAVFTRRIGIVDFPDASGLDSARGLAAYVSSPHSKTGPHSKPGSRTMTGDEAAQMRDYLRTRLPENMIPDAFVAVAEIPLTPEGKINVCLLPEPANQKGDDAALLAAS